MLALCMLCVCTAGVMLLEKQLLMNGESASGGRSVKRARGTAAASDITTTTWVEMSRYTCIHDDVLLCMEIYQSCLQN